MWVSVGHLSERKDPLTVIRAFRAVSSPGRKLVFLGGGALTEACRAAANGDERVVFAGRVENVGDYLRASDGFVSASHAEGFPNAVLEALACGVPCALSDIAPHTEIAEQAGRGVLLFPEGDVCALSCRFEQFVVEPELCAAARNAAEKSFSARGTSERYQELYRELADV